MAMTRCKANLHFYDTEKYDTCPYCEGRNGAFRPVEIPPEDRESGDTCTAPTITLGHQKGKNAVEQASTAVRAAARKSKEETAEKKQGEEEFVQTVLAVGGLSREVEEESAVEEAPAPEEPAAPEEAVSQEAPSQAAVSPQLVQNGGPPVSSTVEPEPQTVMFFGEAEAFNPVVGWLVTLAGPEKGLDYRIKSGMNEIGRDQDPEVDIVIKGDSTISRRHHADIQYDPEDNMFFLIKLKNEAVRINDKPIKRPTQLNAYDILQFGDTRFVFVPLCSEKFQWPSE